MSMTRRTFAIGTAATLASTSLSASPTQFLAPTRYIDSDASAIRKTAAAVTAGLSNDRDRSIALFRFVRDQIQFGFARGFWDMRASEVLRAGVGYCNTKSTLFVALLRAADIPARQVFVDIDKAVLHGLIDPGTSYLDHSYTEVFVDDAWYATDAYIPDPALFAAATTRVMQEGRRFGYGVHSDGKNDWDGRSDSFAQYNRADPAPIGTQVWGIYDDIGDFYDRAPGTQNRLNALLRAGMGALAASANAEANRMRRGA